MYKDKLTQRIIDDVNSIKADLKQLGLNIVIGENSNVHIYCSKLAFINARKKINICNFQYRPSHYTTFKQGEFERNIDSVWNIHSTFTSNYDGETYVDINTLISMQRVKDTLGNLYLENIKL
jgi:hypothetical protein